MRDGRVSPATQRRYSGADDAASDRHQSTNESTVTLCAGLGVAPVVGVLALVLLLLFLLLRLAQELARNRIMTTDNAPPKCSGPAA